MRLSVLIDDTRPGGGTAAGSLFAKGLVLGIEVSTVSRAGLITLLEESVRPGGQLTVTFLNPNYAMAAVADDDLRQRMNSFDVMLPDGWGIVWGGRLLGVPMRERLANDDIGESVFELSERKGWRTFLFGSAPGIAEQAGKNLQEAYPGMPIVGSLHGYWDAHAGHPGYFDDADNEMIIKTINDAAPDVLWVGLPTPLQQRWLSDNIHRLDIGVAITGGSYLDHLAERVRWYPRWATALHACWIYRFGREPRRLFRRYTVELSRYVGLILRAKFGRSR
jgi:N-acetylglucosaminyldiphosphoundecaprenol N-acetyl-beta-D-mannosaminyltransferase